MAAACGSLDDIFEKASLPENPTTTTTTTLVESLISPWNHLQINHKNNNQEDSSTELFGELHFNNNQNNHLLLQSSVSPLLHPLSQEEEIPDEIQSNNYHPINRKQYRGDNFNNSSSFSSMNSESLSLCTEGLGFESSEESSSSSFHFQFQPPNKSSSFDTENSYSKKKKTTSKGGGNGGSFPPPISYIGKTGKPCGVSFKSFRQDGRFILQQTTVPLHETLHASRQDGRLKLHFIHSQSDDEQNVLQQGEIDDCDFGEFTCEENGEIDDEKE